MVCLSLENLFLFWKSLQHQIVCCRLRQELTKWVKIHKMLQIKAGKPEAKQGEETILVYTGYIKAFSIRTHYRSTTSAFSPSGISVDPLKLIIFMKCCMQWLTHSALPAHFFSQFHKVVWVFRTS